MTQSSPITPATISSVSQIPVHRGGAVVAFALVDAGDYERLSRFVWRLANNGYIETFVPGLGRRGRGRKGPGYYEKMHRMVAGLVRGDGVVVDHIHGNKLDNRRAELHIGTQGDNVQNRSGGYGRSKHRGVGWDASRGKWVASAKLPGMRSSKFLGRYADEEEAARVSAAFREQHMECSTEARSSRACRT